jgi:hypothetical protein
MLFFENSDHDVYEPNNFARAEMTCIVKMSVELIRIQQIGPSYLWTFPKLSSQHRILKIKKLLSPYLHLESC